MVVMEVGEWVSILSVVVADAEDLILLDADLPPVAVALGGMERR